MLPNAMIKLNNTTDRKKAIYVVTRELVELEPGEEIEFDGDIELLDVPEQIGFPAE